MPTTTTHRVLFCCGLALTLGVPFRPNPAAADPNFRYTWTSGLEVYTGACPHQCRQRKFAVLDAAGRKLAESTLLYSYMTGDGRLVQIVIDRPDVNYRYSANDLAVIRLGPSGHHVAGVTNLDQAIDRALLDFVRNEVTRTKTPSDGPTNPPPVVQRRPDPAPSAPVEVPLAVSIRRAHYNAVLAEAQAAYDAGEFARASTVAAKAVRSIDTPEARALLAEADRKEAERKAGKVPPRAPKRPKKAPPPIVAADADPQAVPAQRAVAEYFLEQWRTDGKDWAAQRERISPAFLRENPQPTGSLYMYTSSHDYAFLERVARDRLVYILGSKAHGTEHRVTFRFRQEGGRWYLLPRATRSAYFEPWERMQRHGTY